MPSYKPSMPASHRLLYFFFFSLFLLCAETACPICDLSSPSPIGNFTRYPPNIAPSKDDAQLKVLVPNISRQSFRQLVDCSDPSNVRGFCIDIFEIALSILARSSSTNISYTCFDFSVVFDNRTLTNRTLNYNDMIDAVANGTYDVVVGDVTISAQRAYKVAFTQPFLNSGVVIVTKTANDDKRSEWFFFGLPFTWRMWCMVALVFFATGSVLWFVEREENPGFKAFGLAMEALVLLQRESIKSRTGQYTMAAWMCGVLVLSASYTAGLSSLLTANNLSPTTIDIRTIKDSNKPIAFRRGSITQDLLTTRFLVQKGQLRPIRATVDFISNITKGPSSGGVIAIIDELLYANIMLKDLSCKVYGISGPQLTNEGLGFGFRPDLQPWENEVSIALLKLIECGCVQELQDKYKLTATNDECSSSESEYKRLSWRSVLPVSVIFLFIIICGIIISCIWSCLNRNVQPAAEDNASTSNQLDPLVPSISAEEEVEMTPTRSYSRLRTFPFHPPIPPRL